MTRGFLKECDHRISKKHCRLVLNVFQVKLQTQRAQLKQSLVAEAMKECTFKPKTNEGQNRELIAKILRAEDESNISKDTVS